MKPFRALILGLPIAILSAIVVACGPGNNGPVAGTVVLPTPSPVPLTAPAFATVTQTVAVSNASIAAGVTLAATGGVSGTISGGAGANIPAGTTLTQSLQSGSTTPTGLPAPASMVRRSASGSRDTLAELAPISPLIFMGLGFSQTSTIAPSSSFTLPASFFTVTGVAFYVALFDPTRPGLGWISRFASCTPSASTLTLTCPTTTSVTFTGGQTYYLMLYAVSTLAPSPQPTAVVTPTTPNTVAVTAGSVPGTFTLPAAGTVTAATLAIPGASTGAGTVINGIVGSSPVGGLPTLTGTGVTPLYYASLTPTALVSFNSAFSATFRGVPAPPTGSTYYIAGYDSGNASGGYFQKIFTGTFTAGVPNTVTFSGTTPFTFQPRPYGFVLYFGP